MNNKSVFTKRLKKYFLIMTVITVLGQLVMIPYLGYKVAKDITKKGIEKRLKYKMKSKKGITTKSNDSTYTLNQ